MAIQRRTAPQRSHLRLAERLLKAVDGSLRVEAGPLPSAAEIAALADEFLAVFFPARRRGGARRAEERLRDQLAGVLSSLEWRLEEAIFVGLHRRCPHGAPTEGCRARARGITRRVLGALPEIRSILAKDVQAALDGDPAATGPDEVVACYPGLYAIAIFRAAHRLYVEGAEIIPRMLTEHAKARTGIDIHPGARVGPSFFIDHGTGIVVGETTEIGRGVRIYQGVTLGALSIGKMGKRPPDGAKKGVRAGAPAKRHPTIEDDVIIYANATILGGATVIGRGAVIGGNAFITYSVPPGIRVGVGR